VAVPFVGVTAATLVVAEILRLVHGGPAYSEIKLSMGLSRRRFARRSGSYGVKDLDGLTFCGVRSGSG
jgi:hypothetical protein